MNAPELIQQQREIVKRFRKASQQRAQSEASAESRHKQKRTTADVTLQQLEQTAQAQLRRVTTDSEAKLSAEKKAAEDSLAETHNVTARQIKEIQTVKEKAESALKMTRLYSVLDNNTVQPTAVLNTAFSKTEFQKAVVDAKKSLPTLEQLIIDLEKARQATLQRRFVFIVATTVAVLLVVSFSYQTWQQRQARLHVQATATAVAIQAATATVEAISTATAQANATVTAQANATATVIALPAAIAAAQAKATIGTSWMEPVSGIELVYVPMGKFSMGSLVGQGDSDEHPQHILNVDSYWIGKTEITTAQFRQFMDGSGYATRTYWTAAGWEWRSRHNITQPYCWPNRNMNGDNQPVVCVSWYEAKAYTEWLSQAIGLTVRLPTEAEWEKAARGTDGRMYPWGNEEPTADLANYGRTVGKTKDVGSYLTGASPYGAMDMAGNVWEWNTNPYVASDGRENMDAEGLRMLRGGAWDYYLSSVRGAYRLRNLPEHRDDDIGFRVVIPVYSGR